MAGQTQLEKGDPVKIDYDSLILRIGKIGRYQRRVFLILCLTALSCAFNKMGGVFLTARPDFRCLLPDENPENATFEITIDTVNSSYPWDNQTKAWRQCNRYDIDSTNPYHPPSENASATTPTVKCDKFVYDKTQYTLTAAIEWNLVCDSEWLKALGESLFMLADLPGAVILGALSDRYGRRSALLWGSILQSIFGLLVIISPNVNAFIIFRILVGATINGLLVVAYVTVVEMVTPQNRMAVGMSFNISYAFGSIIAAGLAYFIRQWRSLQILFTIPILVLLALWRLVPESARWLITKGRMQKAKAILEKTCSENGIVLSSGTLDGLLRKDSEDCPNVAKTSVFDIVRHPSIRKKTLLLFIIWFTNSITYYGLSLNTSNLEGNDYLNFLIVAAIEVPGNVLLLFILDVWGRRIILFGGMLLSGMALLVTYFVPTDMGWLLKAFAIIGKLGICFSWGSAYISTVEHYPTTMRNIGLGACSAVARLAAAVAPYMNYLFQISTYLPLVTLGLLTLITGLLSLLLPETLNKHLPESIEDSEEFGKNMSKTEKTIKQLAAVDVKKRLTEREDKLY